MKFIGSWLVMTFVVFLIRYYPTPTAVDTDFIIKTFGWGLLWTVIVDIVIVVGLIIVAAIVEALK